MTLLLALLVWTLFLGLIGALAVYAIRQLPIHPTFQRIAIALLCVIAIVFLVGAATGQFPLPGFRMVR